MTDTPAQRLLLVHAHPDDESIGQGATMAKYVAEGRGVTLVTCTAGEMGEILVPELEHLAADQDDGLGLHRRGELDEAMAALGVTDHRFLGGFGTYRDSGMKWHEDGHAVAADDVHDNAFWHADLTEAADHLVERDPRGPAAGAGDLRPVRRLRPPRPHPGAPGRDVRRHARRRAVVPPRPRRGLGHRQDLLGRDVGEPDARGPARAARRRRHHDLRGHGPRRPAAVLRDQGRATSAPPSTRRTTSTARWPRCRAHATQITTDGPFFALSNNVGSAAWGIEFFRLVKGELGPRRARTASRPTCSPGSDEVRGGRRCCLLAGAATALATVVAAPDLVGASCWRSRPPWPRWSRCRRAG